MKKNIIVPIIIIIVMLSIGIYLIVSSKIAANYEPNYLLDDYYVKPEKAGVNEYKVSRVSKEEMLELYFNSYATMLYEDIEKAYSKLSDEAKEKYPNIDSFKTHVKRLTKDFTEIPKIEKYDTALTNDREIYTIRDRNGHYYIFEIEAVMKYTISFELPKNDV